MDDMSEIVGADDDRVGRAYGRPAATYEKVLAEVGPGTPGGELFRRYWQPFALSSEINNDLPVPIRILGEDLVAFRDGEGKVGLMYPRCLHRGADLVYGKLEAEGIRCPYHGWLFDTKGHVLDTPCEPENMGVRKIVRQPWYPVVEVHGLCFTYMGPPDKQPLFPKIPRIFDDLAEDEMIVPTGSSKVATDHRTAMGVGQMDFNWLQYYENFMDPYHLRALHYDINGNQFNDDVYDQPEIVKFRASPDGSGSSWIGIWKSEHTGIVTQGVFQCIVPNMLVGGNVFKPNDTASISWIVPVDDTNFRQLGLNRRRASDGPIQMNLIMHDPEWGPTASKKPYDEWSFEDKQRWQTDYLVQKGLGPINLHSDEHLTPIDAGVAILRRVFKQAADRVAQGLDPVGSVPGEASVIDSYGGGARLDPQTGEVTEGVAVVTVKDY